MIGFRRWYRLLQEGRRLNNLLVDKFEEVEEANARAARYRLAWMSARRRADNNAGSVVFWKQLAGERFDAIQKLNDQIARLNVDINAARDAVTDKPKGMGNLVPTIPPSALGSRDRENAIRLAGLLEEAHDTIDALKKELAERNPS